MSNIVGQVSKDLPYLFAFRGGDISQTIPAVTSQERCGTIADNRHINAKVGCKCKDLPPKRKENDRPYIANEKGAVKTQRNCREVLEEAKERPV